MGYHNFSGTDPVGRSGGTFVTWQDDQVCNILDISPNWIHLTTKDESGKFSIITFIYGFPDLSLRYVLWDWFLQNYQSINDPWIAIGDFNQIRGDGEIVWERPDRVLCNDAWLNVFPKTTLSALPIAASDHSPLILDSCGFKPFCKRPFRFENLWLLFDSCQHVVSNSWDININSSPDIILHEKLNWLRGNLRFWNKREVGNIQQKIKDLSNLLEKIQKNVNNDALVMDEKTIRHQLEFYLDCEETLWAQKARQTWLVNGDRCTAYFHNIVKNRRVQNHINAIQDDSGKWIDDYQTIQQIRISYFKDIFTERNKVHVSDIVKKLQKYQIPSLQNEHIDILNKPFNEEEFVSALNQMKLDGAPGPDGYNVRFYRKFWDIVKVDVQAMINGFFQSAIMDPKLNNSYITLIPKINAPQNFKDFRPISFANVSYKLVSKIMCNRLKVFLTDIIAPNQSAFLKGRLISDNILLATEVMHKIRSTRNGRTGWCALKLDIHKAYDKLSWNFIEAVLRCMSFPEIWIRYIMYCISSVSYHLLFNGGITDNFKPSCGIRQGDPISSYIFILCSNILSCMIRKQEEAKLWKGIKIGRNATPITHLMYADDTLLFFEAKDFNLRAVNSVLNEYADMAGQKMNISKSFLVFSPNIRHNNKREMANFFNLKFHATLGKYLGTYIDCKESKAHVIQDTIDKIESKLKVWKSRLLSQAARFTLIKSVINSYLVYPLSCMQFPKDKCRKIESLMSNFFWGYNGNTPRMHMQNWNDLCKSKETGGLALCNVSAFNEALLAKHMWRIMTNNSSLALSTLSSKYFNSDGNLIVPSNSSWRWKAISKSKDVIFSHLQWQIGDGTSIKTNHQVWWPMLRDQQLISSVADLIQHNNIWNSSLLNRVYDPNTVAVIARIPLSVTGVRDKLVWTGASDGTYRVKDAYNHIVAKSLPQNSPITPGINGVHNSAFWKAIWKLKLPFRIIMFLWRVLNNNLSACSVLKNHHMSLEDVCLACGENGESLNHIFLHCPFARVVWFGTHLSYRTPSIDVLGRCRNLRVMEGRKVDPYAAIKMIYSSWNLYSLSFANHNHITNQYCRHFPKQTKWSTIHTLPHSGVSIVIADKRCGSGGHGGNTRTIFIQVFGYREVLFHAAYTLRQQEDLKLMNLVVIRKGIQLALNTSSIRNCCNIVLLQKNIADVVQAGYKSSTKLQVVGTDINNLLLKFDTYNVFFLESINFRNSFTRKPCNNLMVGWTLL
ncbi:ribonuclease H [Senna tora]|uniref:Ribonuclease H n=1 Tax=Senna tora TaxID=362788 RepID=A0A834XFI6_9FABA|nr:ribonuclease H [Senna tora]